MARGRYDRYPAYVPVAERRAQATRTVKAQEKSGRKTSPVIITRRTIATTFWGKAWCENLERYSDYANRLPRGRTYARNGSVIDLQLAPGQITALVNGSQVYKISITLSALPGKRWDAIRHDCAGGIDSLVELLQGKLSKGVMARVCQPADGLFPAPSELNMSCSCPDSAGLCKHLAAVLYGVGARLDHQPELLFTMRKVDASELVSQASVGIPLAPQTANSEQILAADDLAGLFGLDMGDAAEQHSPPVDEAPKPRRNAAAKATRKEAPRATTGRKTASRKTATAKAAAAKPATRTTLKRAAKAAVASARSTAAKRAPAKSSATETKVRGKTSKTKTSTSAQTKRPTAASRVKATPDVRKTVTRVTRRSTRLP